MVSPATAAAALHDLVAGDAFTVEHDFERSLFHGLIPRHKVFTLREDDAHFLRGQDGYAVARNTVLEVIKGADVLICLSLAHTVGPTEPAPLTGVIFTEAHERHLRLGLDAFTPRQQLVHAASPPAVGVDAGLVDVDRDVLQSITEQRLVELQRTESVQHELGVLLGADRDALPVLVVRDDEGIATEHHAVTATKRLRDVIGDVHLDLKGNVRFIGELHRPLGQVFHVGLSRVEHLIIPYLIGLQLLDDTVVLSSLRLLELLLGGDLADAVSYRPFVGVLTGLLRECRFKSRCKWAVQPAMGAGRGKQGMVTHIFAPSSLRPVANAPSCSGFRSMTAFAPKDISRFRSSLTLPASMSVAPAAMIWSIVY